MKTLDDGNIRLGSYPYVNARVRAMRAKLLTDNDYRKLQNMSVTEITEFLQQQNYAEEINDLSADHEGAELLDLALRQHLANTYQKLYRISPDEVRKLLRAYYLRMDMENIKTILRKKVRDSATNIDPLLHPPQEYSETELEQLVDAPSVEEVLEQVTLPGSRTPLLEKVDDPGNLQEIERIIDTHYYRHLARTAERLPEQGKYFKTFLQLELELKNISLILRMKKAGYERGRIEDELLDIPGSLSTHDYAQLLEAQDYSAAVDVLKDMKVGEYIEDEDITHVERALDRHKLRKGILMLHQNPLSINPVLGYMISKEAEVQNLRIILQAKRNNLGSEFIQTNIIPQVRER